MYEKNMGILEKEYPEIYSDIIKYSKQIEDFNFVLVQNKKGITNLISREGVCLNSRYSPEREAISWVDSIDTEDDTLVIFGLGLGYYLETIRKKFSDKKIIIIEKDLEIFINNLRFRDMTEYLRDENIVFVVNKEPLSLRYLFGYYYEKNKIKNIFFKELPNYRKIQGDYIDEIYDELKKLINSSETNLATEIWCGNIWIYNTFRNMEGIIKIPEFSCLKETLKEKLFIIASAGPSLQKQLKYLKDNENKAIILGVGAAINILEKNEITPHFIMGVDGTKEETNIFKSLKQKESIMVYSNTIHYQSPLSYGGDKVWMKLTGEPYMEAIAKDLDLNLDSIDVGGSIANIALDFASYFNPKAVLLIGQDLCYTDKRVYTSGAVNDRTLAEEKGEGDGFLIEEDIYGNEVYTKKAFLNFKNWFETYLKTRDINFPVYNCTEGGLNIKGMQNKSFKEVLQELSEGEIRSIRSEIRKELCKKSCIDSEAYKSLIDGYKTSVKKLVELSKKRNELLYKLSRNIASKSFDEKFAEIIDITDELESIDFYKKFIQITGELYINAVTTGINRKIEAIDDIIEKREVLLHGISGIYRTIHTSIEVVEASLEGKTYSGLFE